MFKIVFSILLHILIVNQVSSNTRDSLIVEYNKLGQQFVVAENLEFVANELYKMHAKFDEQNEFKYAAFALLYTIDSYYNLSEYSKAKDLLFKTESYFYDHNLQCDYYLTSRLFSLACFIQQKLGNTQLSIYYGKRALDIINEGGPYYSPRNKLIHLFMASSFLANEDYFEAIVEINNFSNYSDISNPNIYTTILGMRGYVEHKLGNKLKAQQIFETGKNYVLQDAVNNSLRVNFYRHISKYYYENQLPDSASIYLNKIAELNPMTNEKLNSLQLKGQLLISKNEFEEGEKVLQDALSFGLDSIPYNAINLAETHYIFASAFYNQNKLDTAINWLNSGLKKLTFTSVNGQNGIINQRKYLEFILLLADCYSGLDNYKMAKKYVIESYSIFQNILNTNINNTDSKLALIEDVKKAYGKFIEYAIKNYDYEFSVDLCQKIHGYLLEQQITKSIKLQDLNLSEDQIRYFNRSKIRLVQIEKELETVRNNLKYDSLSTIAENYRIQIKNITEEFKLVDPMFNMVHSTQESNTIAQIQDKVKSENSAIVEYLIGDDNLCIFLYTKDKFKVFLNPIDSNFIDHIYNVHSHIRSLKSDVSYESYVNSSEQLYKLLLGHVVDNIDNTISQLNIIPDNEINYIPFGVLFDEQANHSQQGRYDLLPYVCKQYDISYHYSVELLYKEYNFFSPSIGSFAPSFKSDYSSSQKLSELLHNQEEILLIDDIIDGEIYIDSSATLYNLKKSIHNYQIAHLATHATCNDTLPFQSRIHMEDGPLYAYEIYNIPQNLNLAVLSACQTGDGVLKKGEGLMSLARAFISSGSKSVITSLWNVNDKKSTTIMSSFYTHLWAGKSVNQSLGKAKRDYLNNTSSVVQAHPYYWATFIAIGNTHSSIFRIPVGDLLLLIVIGFLTIITFWRLIASGLK